MAETQNPNPAAGTQDDLSAQIDALLGEIGGSSPAAPPDAQPDPSPSPAQPADTADLARQMEDILSAGVTPASPPAPADQATADELAKQIESLLTPEEKPAPPPATPLDFPESAITPAPSAPTAGTPAEIPQAAPVVAVAPVAQVPTTPTVTPTPPPQVAVAPAAAPTPPVPAVAVAQSPEPAPAVEAKPSRPRGEALLAALTLASRPIAEKPKIVRDSLGWIALNSLFLGACLWAYVLFFRHPPQAANAGEFDFTEGQLPMPPQAEEASHAPSADGHTEPGKPAKPDEKSHTAKKKPPTKKSEAQEPHGGGH